MSEELKAAQARIACLEGEIAKLDARIAEVEGALLAEQMQAEDLSHELAAIKAQEPVAWVGAIEGGVPLLVVEPQNWKATPLYAAPVSEAKAQVVMPDVNAAAKALCNRHAMICGVDADDQWKEYSQDFIADAETVLANARLNASHVQRVSVPDERIIPTSAELIQWAWEEEPEETRFQEGYNAAKRWVKMQIEAGIAAPEAPAADAGLIDMYRHLQTVTPYRFKKIQDASVTDGGDVLYFHKDRFDAALLDDMAANCAKESK